MNRLGGCTGTGRLFDLPLLHIPHVMSGQPWLAWFLRPRQTRGGSGVAAGLPPSTAGPTASSRNLVPLAAKVVPAPTEEQALRKAFALAAFPVPSPVDQSGAPKPRKSPAGVCRAENWQGWIQGRHRRRSRADAAPARPSKLGFSSRATRWRRDRLADGSSAELPATC